MLKYIKNFVNVVSYRFYNSSNIRGDFLKYFSPTNESLKLDCSMVTSKWCRLLDDMQCVTGWQQMEFLWDRFSQINNLVYDVLFNDDKQLLSLEYLITSSLKMEPTFQLMSSVSALVSNVSVTDYQTGQNLEDVMNRQKRIIECCDMVWFYLLLRSILKTDNANDYLGQKYSLLIGHYIASEMYFRFADLRNTKFLRTVGRTIIEGIHLSLMENIRSDLSSALSSSNVSKDELTTRTDCRSFEYFITTSMWRTRNAYKSQLFGLCSSAPIDCTTDSDLKFKNSAHYFGEHLALALQAYMELQYFLLHSENAENTIPALYCMEYDLSLSIDRSDKNTEFIVSDSSNNEHVGISITETLIRHHALLAISQFEHFRECISKDVLRNLVFSLLESRIPESINYGSKTISICNLV